MSTDRAAPRVTREELLAMMPAQIRQALPTDPWRLQALWDLELPVQRVQVEQLAWLLDLPLWQLDGTRFQVSPRAVREDPERYPDHLNRAMASDLRYPVHLVKYRGRLVVLDGFHRLLKAVLEGRTEIDAMVVSGTDLKAIGAA
ncbi:hypothetical protein KDL01_14150 [Actinospica durhamensis]|uniref:Uncharacterized protein n=1 Tax=Actinospica durhamensis TaxID=1508375 RepID=A0A941ENX3_9ACTN|nr:hypothetical protein [Actinospica durhamensis]MBR7834413.1 hypothetical protein [Actinospica durhamensis]